MAAFNLPHIDLRWVALSVTAFHDRSLLAVDIVTGTTRSHKACQHCFAGVHMRRSSSIE